MGRFGFCFVHGVPYQGGCAACNLEAKHPELAEAHRAREANRAALEAASERLRECMSGDGTGILLDQNVIEALAAWARAYDDVHGAKSTRCPYCEKMVTGVHSCKGDGHEAER